MRIELKVNPAYYDELESDKRYLILYGGAGSGKSYFAAQKILMRIMGEMNHKFLLIRKVAATIRNSQFQLMKELIYLTNTIKYWQIYESTMTAIFKPTNSMFISSGLDDPEKIKSIHGITGIWIEEATELRYEDFKQLDLRLRGKTDNYKQIILSFNPISAHHWLIKKFLYGQNERARVLKTTYKDNKFIDEEYKEILEKLIEEDENLYRIYVLGEPGVIKNLIYNPFESLNKYPESFDEIFYGLDFGYNNPSALVEVGKKDAEFYLTERLYQKGLTNTQLIERLKEIIPEEERQIRPIYADSAEPARIAEIQEAGFLIYPADKNVSFGIDFVKRQKIYTCPGNDNLNKEFLNYKWKEDKDGNVLDVPVKFMDHFPDAVRYAIYTHEAFNHEIDEVEAW